MNAQTITQVQAAVKPAITPVRPGVLQRACACGQHAPGTGGECAECKKKREGQLQRTATSHARGLDVPPIVHEVLHSPGQPMDANTRAFMEPRFGHDFSNLQTHAKNSPPVPARLAVGAPDDSFERDAEQTARRITNQSKTPAGRAYDFSRVRIHTDTRAEASARAVDALAYAAGNDIVFDAGRYAPGTSEGRSLLAHELTHVVQQSGAVQCYRAKTSFNFGKQDDMVFIEDSFDLKKDKETKPWIKLVTVEFTSTKTDANGSNYWAGTASAEYYDNPAKFGDFKFPVAGGSKELGRTDKGSFTVIRIEGVGYNSGSNSGTAGVDYDPANREGPMKRYSKDLSANMSYAVFYNGGEALHAGPVDASSHGCVHVDWNDDTTIKQLNYHSVIGLTKVIVKYP